MASINRNLVHIGKLNLLLADELAKLPEIRWFKTDASRLALDNLLNLYRLAPDRFDHMFAQMNTIGMPEHRFFCSPLQALFWILQDEKLNVFSMLLGLDSAKEADVNSDHPPRLPAASKPAGDQSRSTRTEPDYTLKKILDAAWNGEPQLLPGANIHKIIHRLQADAETREYALLAKRHTDRQLQSYIMDDFMTKKEVFSVNDWEAIEKAIKRSRWKLFQTVADRLNSPELISYYMNKYFYFRKTPAHGIYFTFFQKTAQCTDAAYFAQFMLARAGYKTFMRSVKWDEDPWDGLHTGAGIILDDGRYLLVSNYTGINSLSGPFADIDNLDQTLSCNKKIIGRKWGAYYPPRYY